MSDSSKSKLTDGQIGVKINPKFLHWKLPTEKIYARNLILWAKKKKGSESATQLAHFEAAQNHSIDLHGSNDWVL